MLSVVVQAGGQSTRMNENKALKLFLKGPLIQRVIARLAPIANEMLVTTNQAADFAFLNLPLFPDLKRGRGPLGGLYTALVSAKNPIVAVVACDMPFANAQLLEAAASILIQEEADLVIAETPEGFEPLHAIYRRKNCIPVPGPAGCIARTSCSDQRRNCTHSRFSLWLSRLRSGNRY